MRFDIAHFLIFSTLLVNLCQNCKFQKIESHSKNFNLLLDSIDTRQDIVSYSFSHRMKVVRSNRKDCITLANLEKGCLLCFKIQDGTLRDSCTINLISSELPVYEIFEIDSIYFLSYGFEEDITTEIYSPKVGYDTIFKGYDLNDAKNSLLLLTESNLIELNSEILLYNINERLLKQLNVSGEAIFSTSINDLLIAKMDENGNSSVFHYFLSSSELVHIFNFKGDLYLLGFNTVDNKVYFLGNSRQGIFEYELGSKEPVKLLDRYIYSPVYSDIFKTIFYLDETGHTLFIYPVY
jgi:hypothetical protein